MPYPMRVYIAKTINLCFCRIQFSFIRNLLYRWNKYLVLQNGHEVVALTVVPCESNLLYWLKQAFAVWKYTFIPGVTATGPRYEKTRSHKTRNEIVEKFCTFDSSQDRLVWLQLFNQHSTKVRFVRAMRLSADFVIVRLNADHRHIKQMKFKSSPSLNWLFYFRHP